MCWFLAWTEFKDRLCLAYKMYFVWNFQYLKMRVSLGKWDSLTTLSELSRGWPLEQWKPLLCPLSTSGWLHLFSLPSPAGIWGFGSWSLSTYPSTYLPFTYLITHRLPPSLFLTICLFKHILLCFTKDLKLIIRNTCNKIKRNKVIRKTALENIN